MQHDPDHCSGDPQLVQRAMHGRRRCAQFSCFVSRLTSTAHTACATFLLDSVLRSAQHARWQRCAASVIGDIMICVLQTKRGGAA